MSQQAITLTVNGQEHVVHADPATPLLQILRQDLGLKGAKQACGQEQCGACRILLDGQAVPSCCLPLQDAGSRPIETVEGLARGHVLDDLQQAFIAEQAIQCGYCVAGMLMSAKALLRQNPRPSEAEIHAALHRNLCRCGVYHRVVRAVQRASGQSLSAPRVYQEITPATGEGDAGPADADGRGALPASLQQNPDLDDWIRLRGDGTVEVFTGKVELGQGIITALAQVVAEELDVRIDQLRIHTADTALTPDEGATAGSMSLEVSGGALRQAAAEVRYHLLTLAAEEWEVPWTELVVAEGEIRHSPSGRHTTYGDLLQDQRLAIQATGTVAAKPHTQYTIVGQPVARLDLEAKVQGKPSFLHDMELPAMVHGRIIRGPYATSRRTAMDPGVLDTLPEATRIVENGEFLAVLCEREDTAIRAMELLRAGCTWETPETLPAHEALFDTMQQAPSEDFLVVDGLPGSEPIPPLPLQNGTACLHRARYARPYHMHAALGPSCAIAQWHEGTMTVWSHSQGVFQLRDALAQILDLAPERVRVIHAEGPGCYGHNGADDVALDACLLALEVPGRPVRVQWSSRDEFIYEPYGSAMVMEVAARLDADMRLAYWRQEISSYTHMGRPQRTAEKDTATLLAAWSLARPLVPPRPQPSLAPHVGLHRNGTPQYRIPETVTVKHFLPDNLLRVSSMRSLGAYANIFAIESMMDDLARAAAQDPVDFRLRHLEDERGAAVIQLLATEMGWYHRHAARTPGRGWGMAYVRYKNRQTYAAIGVVLTVDPETGTVHLDQGFIAADSGHIVNPDGLSAQLEGSFVQAASWTLCEQVVFNRQGVTSVDWETYPILRAAQTPRIRTFLLRRDGAPVMGAGEAAQCPVPAAIANAICDAIGVRLYEIPFTPARIRAILAAHPKTA